MVDLSEVEITQNECFVTHVYEIQLASGDALEELNAHLLREIRAIRAGGEEGIDYPGAGWQTPHDLIQRPAFAEAFGEGHQALVIQKASEWLEKGPSSGGGSGGGFFDKLGLKV